MTGRALIAGAGLGGLTAALCLRRAGWDVEVLERAPAIGEVGAGIQISPNAVKVLRALGLEEGLRAIAVEPAHFHGMDWKSGRRLYRTPIAPGFEERFGAGYFHVHRADLHALLADALPHNCIRTGVAVTAARTEGAEAVLETDSGPRRADVAIGADGIHSAVRASLFGPENPRFTGNIAFRFTVDPARLQHALPRDAMNLLGPAGHVVLYYLRGGALLNVVAVHETRSWEEESWSTPASREEVAAAFPGWAPLVQDLIAASEERFKWSLNDRDPLERWSAGRITLLGDAAHPMLPFLAQGAAMAIEDGIVLANCLAAAGRDEAEAALSRYEALRKPRTSRVQLGARARAASMHLRSPWARLRRNLGYAWGNLVARGRTKHAGEWIYAHDPVAEGKAPPTPPPGEGEAARGAA
ncbi:MAG: FAD-dependent monooxygenase [Rhodobacteraceae bacterium]|nr:FAD-dependent monooxygenase [Paracoccaceae bacterium]